MIGALKYTALTKPVLSVFLFFGILFLGTNSSYIHKISRELEARPLSPLDSLRRVNSMTLQEIKGKIRYYELKPSSNDN